MGISLLGSMLNTVTSFENIINLFAIIKEI